MVLFWGVGGGAAAGGCGSDIHICFYWIARQPDSVVRYFFIKALAAQLINLIEGALVNTC